MMKSTLQRIEEIKRNGYQLDLGEAINEIFENYKKVALLSGAVLLLVAVVATVVVGGFTAVFLGLAAVTETFTEMSEGTPLTSTALILNFVLTVIGYGLFAPIAAGLIQLVHNASINEDFDFGTAFIHFKTVHFKELFISAAIVTIVGSGLSTAIQIISLNNPEGLLFFGSIVGVIISILVPLFTLVTIPAIIFGKLQALDAIKASFVIVSKNVWTIALLAILFFIFAMLGIIALCIGIFFTLPVFYSMQYVIYKAAVPIDKMDELDEIGKDIF